MTMTKYELLDWNPDQTKYKANIFEINNLIPVEGGYIPAAGYKLYSDTPLAKHIAVIDNYIFSDTIIYKSIQSVLYNIATISVTNGRWYVRKFQDYILALNDRVGLYKLENDTLTQITTDVAGLRGKYFTINANYIVLAHTTENADGTIGSRVRWSAIGDPNKFQSNAKTGADFQDIIGYGDILNIEGEYIFLENSIHRMVRVGGALGFTFTSISELQILPNSKILQKDDIIYFLTKQGVYGIDTRTGVISDIGKNKINKWLRNNIDFDNKEYITGAKTFENDFLWIIPTKTGNRALFYVDGRFSITKLGATDSGFLTTDSGLVDSFTTETVDSMDIEIDSPTFDNKEKFLVVVKDNKLHTLDFTNNTQATIKTKIIHTENYDFIRITEIICNILGDFVGLQARIHFSTNLDENKMNVTNWATINDREEIKILAAGRIFQFEFKFPRSTYRIDSFSFRSHILGTK